MSRSEQQPDIRCSAGTESHAESVQLAPVLLASLCAVWVGLIIALAGLTASGQNTKADKKSAEESGAAKKADAGKKAEPAEADPATENSPDKPEEPAEDDRLPLIDQMKLPTLAECLTGKPVDWLVLRSKRVIVAEPVQPRPMTLEKVAQRVKDSVKNPETAGPSEEARAKRKALTYIPVSLIDPEEPDYKINYQYLQEIIHWEDLMLRRVDELISEKRVIEALQLWIVVRDRDANWPGLTQRYEKLLFSDAQYKRDAGQLEAALVLYEELQRQSPDYPQLKEQMGELIDQLVRQAVEAKDYRRGRLFVRRLKSAYSDHATAARWHGEFARQATALIQAAEATAPALTPAEAMDRLEEAARWAPDLEALPAAYRRVFDRWPRLRVGVIGRLESWGPPSAAMLDHHRQEQLVTRTWFTPARMVEGVVRFESPCFEGWEPTALGYQLQFQVRRGAAANELATAFALQLKNCIDPASRQYDERLGSYLKQIRVLDPYHFRAELALTPLRPEAIFWWMGLRRPERMESKSVPPAADSSASVVAPPATRPGSGIESAPTAAAKAEPPVVSGDAGTPPNATDRKADPDITAAPVITAGQPRSSDAKADDGDAQGGVRLAGRYRLFEQQPDRNIFRGVSQERTAFGGRPPTELIETRYADSKLAIQGLLRGEVSMLTRVPLSAVRELQTRSELSVLPYALAETHLLQFRPGSVPLSNRALRRAISYAIPRQTILDTHLVPSKDSGLGRLTTAPYPSQSLAYDRQIVPQTFDLALAISLTSAARKELNDKLPELTFWAAADEQTDPAVQALLTAWKRSGLTVRLLPQDDPDGWRSADLVYRVLSMAEPLVELWPLLTLTGETNVESLQQFPVWLRRRLMELDTVGDSATALSLLHELHRQLWTEAYLIPLWELQPHLVVRRHVRALPGAPMMVYQSIDRWQMDAWYARD